MTDSIPVITLDGPAASGKGTIAARVADALGFYYLDSGALYRIATLNALSKGIDLDDADALTASAEKLEPVFDGDRILLEGRDVTTAIRAEEVSAATSCVAAVLGVRLCLRFRRMRLDFPDLLQMAETWERWCFPMRRSRFS
jgi:cytidylate kinase